MTQPVPGTGAAMTPEPKVDVHRTSEGLVIGLTDDDNFAMFASASAEPSPRMVLLMEKIGRLLKTEKGAITIRGFTDNKPFKSDAYDNWRLSSARADMAHYMLVRGGLDDQRIDRIEGYADRRPKNPKDPGSAENRRIEILLRESTP
jgi:chemotaxis protein MotB